MGRKKRPFYRLVAIDSRKRRDGLEIERLGWYNPVHDGVSCELKEERVLYWLKQGAMPSDTVSGLFKRTGLSYKWDLIQKGTKEDKIEKLLAEWSDRQKAKEALKLEKKKVKKSSSSVESEAEAAPESEAATEAEAPEVEAAPESAAAAEAESAAEAADSDTEPDDDNKISDEQKK